MTYTITSSPWIGRSSAERTRPSSTRACAAGVWLPHSCTHGTCATCKADVLDGEVDHSDASAVRADGLRAQRGQGADLHGHPRLRRHHRGRRRRRGGRRVPPGQDYTGTVVALRGLRPRAPAGWSSISTRTSVFNAGPVRSGAHPRRRDVNRTWSVASPPGRAAPVELHIRRTPRRARHRRLGVQGPRGSATRCRSPARTAGSSSAKPDDERPRS